MSTIYDLEGYPLAEGLQGCLVCDEALNTAIWFADELDESVELHDDDGVWVIHPVRNGHRKAAELLEGKA